jgi:hypothetical protein
MTIRALALALLIAAGGAATAAILSSSSAAVAALPQAQKEARPAISHTDSPAELCRQAVWPHIPSSCLRNAGEERAKRPVRIIPIHSPAGR